MSADGYAHLVKLHGAEQPSRVLQYITWKIRIHFLFQSPDYFSVKFSNKISFVVLFKRRTVCAIT